MGSDSPLSARMDAQLRAGGIPIDHIDRPQFFADVQALELRLAIIDDRFDRLAARPDDAYQAWRRDTMTRLRSIADRAGALDAGGELEPHRRRHVVALLTVLRRRIVQLDERHARYGDRRARRRDGPVQGGTPHVSFPALIPVDEDERPRRRELALRVSDSRVAIRADAPRTDEVTNAR